MFQRSNRNLSGHDCGLPDRIPGQMSKDEPFAFQKDEAGPVLRLFSLMGSLVQWVNDHMLCRAIGRKSHQAALNNQRSTLKILLGILPIACRSQMPIYRQMRFETTSFSIFAAKLACFALSL